MNSSSQQTNKKMIGFFIGGLLLGVIVTIGVFRTQDKKKPVDISSALGTPLVKVDGKVYTSTDLPGDAGMEYYMLQNNVYAAKQSFADQVAIRIALAKDANKPISSTELPKLTDVLPINPVSDFEAKQYYDKIIAQMGKSVFGGQSFEQIKSQLEARMNQEKTSNVLSKKLQELQSGGRIQSLLEKPIAPSVSLDLKGYPARGNLTSSVTLVEVADYLCPHCREAEPVMENIYKEYKDKIKFVHVSFPLQPSALSGALARGAFCANKEGADKFWAYHVQAFQVPWDKNKVPTALDPATYYNNVTSEVAQRAGLDATAFSACLKSKDSTDYIQSVGQAFNESKGFQGTPTFYLNNKIIQASPEQLDSTLRVALEKKS